MLRTEVRTPAGVGRWFCFLQIVFTWLLLLTAPLLVQGQNASASVRQSARVIAVHDAGACEAFRPNPDIVRAMVECGLTNLTGKGSVAEAWRSLVSTQDVVGIKVFSLPGPTSGTRPAVVAAIIEGLLASGVPSKSIIIWDKQSKDLRLAGYYDLAEKYKVRAAGSAQAGYDESTFYDTALIGNLLWGDLEFGRKGPGIGRKSYFSKLVSKEITKIINVTPLLNHNSVGVTGNLYSLASGSVDNFYRFEVEGSRLATAVPEIYGQPSIFDHVVLNIVDALICQYEGDERGLLHYSTTLNELWFSRDPVALDSLSLQTLERQRQAASTPVANKPNLDLYSNAALLELGVNDLKRVNVLRFELGQGRANY